MLDKIIGSVAASVLGGGENQQKAIQLIQALLASQGGIQGLIEKLQHGGFADLVKSWISTGENSPISTTQVTELFGSENIDNAAKEVGVQQHEAPNLLSEYLPKIVDMLSPDGKLDLKNFNTNSLLEQGAKAVLGKLSSKFFG